jgi:hypothetical protein
MLTTVKQPDFPCGQIAPLTLSIPAAMQPASHIAFKEWAVVVEALGSGEQILILRKGGIRETSGQFHLQHREFWLFPTLHHEAESAIIPSKRPALRHIAAHAPKEFIPIQFYVIADPVIHITDPTLLGRLQGRHIWTEQLLQQRFAFGRQPGLHALLARVYRRPTPEQLPLSDRYAGCKSWVELQHPISTAGLKPVLSDEEFHHRRNEICELLGHHALAHP